MKESFFSVFQISVVLTEGSSLLPSYAKKELWPYYQIKCDLKCMYGYKTDMEGQYFCKCYDPCENIYCHSSSKCVVNVPKRTDCDWSSCKAKAFCQETKTRPKKKNRKKYLWHLDNTPQRDDGSVTSSEKGHGVCHMPLEEEAKKCTKLRKRWYFDPISGQCRKFRGCRTGGNNFGRKKRCKRKCLSKTKLAKRKGHSRGRKSRRFIK
ncbi:hypothetical protein SNE40_010662 [Patella caerulea]|uniref:BPTI/Kunitz inhibitor domain-containing protein n=1 Tax=Patella caerulea TaxID=87958 RepID=A0AAN8JU04_PATCE